MTVASLVTEHSLAECEATAQCIVPWLLRDAPEESEIGSGQRIQIAKSLRPIERRWHCLLPFLTDTHCHLAGYGAQSRRKFLEESTSPTLGDATPPDRCRHLIAPGGFAGQYVVVSVEPNDWKYCAAVSWPHPSTLPILRDADNNDDFPSGVKSAGSVR